MSSIGHVGLELFYWHCIFSFWPTIAGNIHWGASANTIKRWAAFFLLPGTKFGAKNFKSWPKYKHLLFSSLLCAIELAKTAFNLLRISLIGHVEVMLFYWFCIFSFWSTITGRHSMRCKYKQMSWFFWVSGDEIQLQKFLVIAQEQTSLVLSSTVNNKTVTKMRI